MNKKLKMGLLITLLFTAFVFPAKAHLKEVTAKDIPQFNELVSSLNLSNEFKTTLSKENWIEGVYWVEDSNGIGYHQECIHKGTVLKDVHYKVGGNVLMKKKSFILPEHHLKEYGYDKVDISMLEHDGHLVLLEEFEVNEDVQALHKQDQLDQGTPEEMIGGLSESYRFQQIRPVLYKPTIVIQHLSVDGELLEKETVVDENMYIGLDFRGFSDEVFIESEFEELKELGFDFQLFGVNKDEILKTISKKPIIRNFKSKSFKGLEPLYTELEVNILEQNTINFYYAPNDVLTTTTTDNKGEADLVIKNVGAGGEELSTRQLDLLPGEYELEPEQIKGYKTTSEPVKVLLENGETEEVIFVYDKSFPIIPIAAATVGGGFFFLILLRNRKGAIIYKLNEDGTRIKVGTANVKSTPNGLVLDISKSSQGIDIEQLEIELLKHTTRKFAEKELTITDNKELNRTDIIPLLANQSYIIKL